EVDAAVLGDHTVAERAGQTAVAALADAHRPGDAPGDGVVDHHAVHRAEGTLVVAVVVAPVAYLDDGEPLSDQSVQKRLRGHGWGHQAPPISVGKYDQTTPVEGACPRPHPVLHGERVRARHEVVVEHRVTALEKTARLRRVEC